MTKQTSLLPKMEVLIIIVFFIGFTIWVVDKCGDTKRTYNDQLKAEGHAIDEFIKKDEDTTVELSATDSLATTPATATEAVPTPLSLPGRDASVLYVTIDGLNLRDQPNLNGKVLTRLKLFEEVAFLGEVTDSTEQINLGKITADEPWVKVQGRGHVGWVYGAGVEYYKKKLEGAE